jgi:hypothetical protein
MSSAQSLLKPDHKVQPSHAEGVVHPAGSESKDGSSTTPASQAESLLATKKLASGTNTDLGERKPAKKAVRPNEQSLRLIDDSIPAAGEVELQNRQVSEYTGKTAEEMKNWAANENPSSG